MTINVIISQKSIYIYELHINRYDFLIAISDTLPQYERWDGWSGSIGKELLRAADLSEEKEDLFKFENDESWIMRYERELVYFILCELNFELVLRFLYTV